RQFTLRAAMAAVLASALACTLYLEVYRSNSGPVPLHVASSTILAVILSSVAIGSLLKSSFAEIMALIVVSCLIVMGLIRFKSVWISCRESNLYLFDICLAAAFVLPAVVKKIAVEAMVPGTSRDRVLSTASWIQLLFINILVVLTIRVISIVCYSYNIF